MGRNWFRSSWEAGPYHSLLFLGKLQREADMKFERHQRSRVGYCHSPVCFSSRLPLYSVWHCYVTIRTITSGVTVCVCAVRKSHASSTPSNPRQLAVQAVASKWLEATALVWWCMAKETLQLDIFNPIHSEDYHSITIE